MPGASDRAIKELHMACGEAGVYLPLGETAAPALRTGDPHRPANEPSSVLEIPFFAVTSSLLEESCGIRLSRAIPTSGLFSQIGVDFPRVRLDEGDGAFQRLSRVERGEIGEHVVDCLARRTA